MSTVIADRSVANEKKRDRRRKEKNVCTHIYAYMHVNVRIWQRETERKRENVHAWVCTGCRRERWTRTALAEREEEANRLHYANAVQLQLTVAKNRCRYRGMLSRTPRGFLHSSFSLFLALVHLLSISFNALRLFHDSGYIPAEWNGAEGVDRIAISLFVLYIVENLSPVLFFSLSLFFSPQFLFFFVHRRCAHYPTILPNVSIEYFILITG